MIIILWFLAATGHFLLAIFSFFSLLLKKQGIKYYRI
jgi:hypothetical protein